MTIQISEKSVELSRLDAAKYVFRTKGFMASFCAFFKGRVITLSEADLYVQKYGQDNLFNKLNDYNIKVQEDEKKKEDLNKVTQQYAELLNENKSLTDKNNHLINENNLLIQDKNALPTLRHLKTLLANLDRQIETKNKEILNLELRIANADRKMEIENKKEENE